MHSSSVVREKKLSDGTKIKLSLELQSELNTDNFEGLEMISKEIRTLCMESVGDSMGNKASEILKQMLGL